MTKLTKVLSTGAVAGLILTGQVAQLTTVFAEDYTENIQQTWEKEDSAFNAAMLHGDLSDENKQIIATLKEQREIIAENYIQAKKELDSVKEKYDLVEDKTELQSMLDEAQAKYDKIKEYFDVSATVTNNLELIEQGLNEFQAPTLPDLTDNATLTEKLDTLLSGIRTQFVSLDANTPLTLEDVKNYLNDKAILRALEQTKQEMTEKLATMQSEYDNTTDKTALETPLAEQKERVNKVSNSVNELIAIMKDYLASVKNKSYIVNYSFSPEKFVKKEEPSEKPNEEKPSEEETPKQEEKKEETKPEEKKQEEKKEEKKEVNSSKKENIPTGVESYFLTYVGLALVSGAGVYKLTKE